MDDDLIIAYSDIWFEEKSVQNIYESVGDFVIAVDQDWEKYYQGRTDHPISEAENVNYDHNLHVVKIGKHISSTEDNSQNIGEFMGLLKISKNIIGDIINEFENIEKNIKNTDTFQNAEKFQNAYLTDFIQYLIDKDYDISCSMNKQGWYEVDTLQDLNNLKSNLGISNDRK
jgi:choline kinase